MLNGASRLTHSVSHDRFRYAFWLVEELWSMYQFSSGDWVMVKEFSEGDHLDAFVFDMCWDLELLQVVNQAKV